MLHRFEVVMLYPATVTRTLFACLLVVDIMTTGLDWLVEAFWPPWFKGFPSKFCSVISTSLRCSFRWTKTNKAWGSWCHNSSTTYETCRARLQLHQVHCDDTDVFFLLLDYCSAKQVTATNSNGTHQPPASHNQHWGDSKAAEGHGKQFTTSML